MEEPVQENEGRHRWLTLAPDAQRFGLCARGDRRDGEETADALLGDALDGTSVGVRRDIVLDFAIALRPECRERSE